jgi:hypothetical protein
MESLGGNLISYKEVIDFLETKGRSKNFFDTLRTRHRLIHAPIVKRPESLSIKEMGIKIRRGRSVYFLQEIISFLGEIIRLLDQEHLTFKQVEERMRDRKNQLDELRKIELADDSHVKSVEFLGQYEIAKIKLAEYFEWTDDDKERRFLDYISKERELRGRLYYQATKILAGMVKDGSKEDKEGIVEQREYNGRRLEFCHRIMQATIDQFKDLLHTGKIKMTADDWKEAIARVDKKR